MSPAAGSTSMTGIIKNRAELSRTRFHEDILDIVEEGLRAADPYYAVSHSISYSSASDTLYVQSEAIELRGSRVHVVGFGKASARMAEAVVDKLGDRIAGGTVIAPDREGLVGPVKVVRGDHPIPGENTLKASMDLLGYLESNVSENDVVFVLVSGGGSALFEVPHEEVTLQDIADVSRELMRRGADIVELNSVRKRLSKVKGGKLLRYIKARRVVTLIISDVIDDRLDTIASGPTAPDETTVEFAIGVLKRRGLWDSLKPQIREVILKAKQSPEYDTVKHGDPVLGKVRNIIVASNIMSLRRMSQKAGEKGYNSVILSHSVEGEAREVGKVLAAVMKSVALHGVPTRRPVLILAGGETTVTVRGNGVGGRNQELCLSIAVSLSRSGAYKAIGDFVAMCIGSDGIDGVSPAAGAIVDKELFELADALGEDMETYLDNNDSYTFFSKLGKAVFTGYTGTNVNDFFLALIP